LFVTYFPHLIAGPVLHHSQMMPQFANPAIYRFDGANFAVRISAHRGRHFRLIVDAVSA
jgi:alginate O-acetyltransferase complex protein AlgI